MAALAGAGGLGAIGGAQAVPGDQSANQQTDQMRINKSDRTRSLPSVAEILKAIGGGSSRHLLRPRLKNGPGWSNRHVKRMALKKRNKARFRAANRG